MLSPAPLAAVDEVGSHRRPGAIGILPRNGV
ncbi:MAG: hypothetical protein RJA10_3138, partial [Pseudomonadota bacterium]